mmetsp:Transcript_88110/g.235750  ORF Transcript_88110/g.235750 Transcript_88110/m.235750 type:complete len:249 (-) Transcript_88110:1348-2094(-)
MFVRRPCRFKRCSKPHQQTDELILGHLEHLGSAALEACSAKSKLQTHEGSRVMIWHGFDPDCLTHFGNIELLVLLEVCLRKEVPSLLRAGSRLLQALHELLDLDELVLSVSFHAAESLRDEAVFGPHDGAAGLCDSHCTAEFIEAHNGIIVQVKELKRRFCIALRDPCFCQYIAEFKQINTVTVVGVQGVVRDPIDGKLNLKVMRCLHENLVVHNSLAELCDSQSAIVVVVNVCEHSDRIRPRDPGAG